MSKLTVTNFSKKTGSPFQSKPKEENVIAHEEVLQKSQFEKQKEKQNELIQKVSKKAADYQSNKPSSGVFTEVVTHGAFTSKNTTKDKTAKAENAPVAKNNGSNGTNKYLLGFPSSANDLALDAKSDLESDPNITKDVKDKVIDKLFRLVSMVQHSYEAKVRITTEFEKYKDTQMINEIRREREHSEQLYKLNMNFQSEIVQSIQRLKSELDLSRNVSKNLEENNSNLKASSVDFNISDDLQDTELGEKGDQSDGVTEESRDVSESKNCDDICND